jgi:hypothetical protein
LLSAIIFPGGSQNVAALANDQCLRAGRANVDGQDEFQFSGLRP